MATITEAANPPARPLSFFAIVIMLLLCLSWGINNVMVKLALPEVPPLMQATARSIGGFLVIVIVVLAARHSAVSARRHAGAGSVDGHRVRARVRGDLLRAAVHDRQPRGDLLYTAPFFVAFGAVNLLGEKLRADQWAGSRARLCRHRRRDRRAAGRCRRRTCLFGDLLLILGALGWGGTTLVFKMSNLSKAPAGKDADLPDRHLRAAAGARLLHCRRNADEDAGPGRARRR